MKYAALWSLILGALWTGTSVATPKQWQVVTEHFPPYSFIQGNQLTGFSTELIGLAFSQLGYDYYPELYPWARAYKMVQENQNVLIYSLGRTQEREVQFQWIGPLSSVDVYLWQRKNSQTISMTSLAEVQYIRLAFVRDSAIETKLKVDHHYPDYNLYAVSEIESGLQMLMQNRVDGVLMSASMQPKLSDFLTKHRDVIERRQKVLELSLYAAINKKGDPAFALKMQRQIEKIKQGSKYLELLQKYGLNQEQVLVRE